MIKNPNTQPIKPDFQIKFILKFSIIMFIAFLVASLLLYLLINEKIDVSYFYSLYFLQQLNRNLAKYLLYSFFFQLILITITTIIITLFSSHKIAGPLFRLERIIEQITRGEIPKEVRIRAKDQIKSFANSMDNLVKEIRRKVITVKSSLENIEKRKKKIDLLIKEKKIDALKEELNIVNEEIDIIERTLSSFKTE
jgi:methyl-accepting chemotaxis protein